MKLKEINQPLLEWFYQNQRNMPWRNHPSFYYVWVSEIMLQQTRVDAVIPYFERFVEQLPTIESLAQADEDVLLKLWEGLGYYNRVRNLQIAAKQIMEEYQGTPPSSYDDLIKLKGIGEYTAGAILSIVYNQKKAAVDGNVLRVLSRVLGDSSDITLLTTKKRMKELIEQNMPDDARGFTQSLMELGALICIPNGKPKCESCPIRSFCKAYQTNTISQFPVKKASKKRSIEKRTVLLILYQNKILLEKRTNSGLLKGLYEYPSIEGHFTKNEMKYYLDELGLYAPEMKKIVSAKHIFSHKEWHLQGYVVPLIDSALGINKHLKDGTWVSIEEIHQVYSIPKAYQTYTNWLDEYFQ